MRDYDDLTKEELQFIESIKIGEEYYFGEICKEYHGDENELLDDGSYSPDEWNVIEFDVIKRDYESPWKSLVKVTDIC